MRITRRGLIFSGLALGGGMLIGVQIAGRQRRRDVADAVLGDGEALFDVWIKIGRDSRVTVYSAHCEMGQGVYTALPMLVAEELGAAWEDVVVEHAPALPAFANGEIILTFVEQMTGFRPSGLLRAPARFATDTAARWMDMMFTGGSTSVRATGWTTLREAGAAAREVLIATAAERWEVPPGDCAAEDSHVLHRPSGRRVPFGELADAAADRDLPSRPALRPRGEWRIVGRPVPRVDIPAKCDGSALFGTDSRFPGLAHAALAAGPGPGFRVTGHDAAAVAGLPGVREVVALDHAVAVVADSWWEARRAADALDVEFEPVGEPVDSGRIEERIRAALEADDADVRAEHGDVDAALNGAGGARLTAEYVAPFLAHACMEPMDCTAWYREGRLELWSPNQAPLMIRADAAEATGLDEDDVLVHTTLLGGGFGRRYVPDVSTEAARIAVALDGPVSLMWDRPQDLALGFFRPFVVSRFEAALGDDGLPVAWSNRFNGASTAVDLLPYTVANARASAVEVEHGVPTGPWRSVDHSQHAFFIESFVDELAAAAGRDPLEYRLALLPGDSRLAGVIRRLAERVAGEAPPPAGRGRGFAAHECYGSWVAQMAEVGFENGRARVHRVICVVDCGTVVNPDTVRAQMEGGIVYGLTAALYGENTFVDGRAEQGNFNRYRMVTLADCPAIETIIVASDAPPGGVGEPGTPPIAPAVTNALVAAGGPRVRRLPLARHGLA